MAMNIFATEPIYGGWRKKGENVALKDAATGMFDSFDDEVEVTESDRGYGKSMCFFMNNGANRVYKTLSSTSKLKVGDKLNKNDVYVTVLSKPGEEDIYRVTEEKLLIICYG